MRRLDRAYERLADRGFRSDPESVIDRLERRLAGESDVIALSVVTPAGRRECRARLQWTHCLLPAHTVVCKRSAGWR